MPVKLFRLGWNLRSLSLISLRKPWLQDRSMALFNQVQNPISGASGWVPQNDDYDYQQEVAAAGYGDMLHDTERNKKYFAALRGEIARMHAAGLEVHVLDIGTGTGLLAMMAAEAGADTVTACEMFVPMANCAERILAANGFGERIRLIKKRSTDLIVGPGENADMPRRANLLVAEVLDTELIGEGALGIYNHAHEMLLTDDAVCIPSRARCYAQVVQSSMAAQWDTMKAVANLDGDILLRTPKAVAVCKGTAALHDMQLSQLPASTFRTLVKPCEIFVFDFSCKEPRELRRSRNIYLQTLSPGATGLVFFWWEIDMDVKGDIKLSCAPFWAHPDLPVALNIPPEEGQRRMPLPNLLPWRDHWMQAVYYVPTPQQLRSSKGEFVLHCNHDEFSFWFDTLDIAKVGANSSVIRSTPRHACSCHLHLAYSRSRIGQMNESKRNKSYMRHLEETVHEGARVLSLGDGCLLGLSSVPLGAVSVICHEPQMLSRSFMQSVVQANALRGVQLVEQLDTLDDSAFAQLTHVFAEPYFLNAILPWDNLHFGKLLSDILAKLPAEVQITPYSARLWALPVEFLDLHKIRLPVGQCEGFDLTLFDEMVQSAANLALSNVEAQPLWEYPCIALGQPQELLNVVFRNFNELLSATGVLPIESAGSCNGIAVWVDWHLDDTDAPQTIVTTGPLVPIVPGEYVRWDMYVRQGVHLFGEVSENQNPGDEIKWTARFQPDIGQMSFHFEKRK